MTDERRLLNGILWPQVPFAGWHRKFTLTPVKEDYPTWQQAGLYQAMAVYLTPTNLRKIRCCSLHPLSGA